MIIKGAVLIISFFVFALQGMKITPQITQMMQNYRIGKKLRTLTEQPKEYQVGTQSHNNKVCQKKQSDTVWNWQNIEKIIKTKFDTFDNVD